MSLAVFRDGMSNTIALSEKLVGSIAEKIEVPKAVPSGRADLSGGGQAANLVRVDVGSNPTTWLTAALIVAGVASIVAGTAVWRRRRG